MVVYMGDKTKKGSVLLALAFVVMLIVGIVTTVLFNLNMVNKATLESTRDATIALYMAERGLIYAYTELQEHNLNWTTHTMDSQTGLLRPNTVHPTITVSGASFSQDGDYLPFGTEDVRVRVYKDQNGTIWQVARAEYNGAVKVIRASMISGNLLEFLFFYNQKHTFNGIYVDGKGIGKIYVNGDIKFYHWSETEFKDIAMLSTNADGAFRTEYQSKLPPYAWDMGKKIKYGYLKEMKYIYSNKSKVDAWYDKNEGAIDGWALLPMSKSELGGGDFDRDYYYGRDGTRFAYDPIRYLRAIPAYSITSNVKFTFTGATQDAGYIDLNGASEANIDLPLRLFDSSGQPLDYDVDQYMQWSPWEFYYRDKYGENLTRDADEIDEKPVKFVRLYKDLGNGKYKIVGDPRNADYAQVFDMKDTAAEGTTQIEMKYWDKAAGEWKTKTIPVKEDVNVEYKGQLYHYDTSSEEFWWKDKIENTDLSTYKFTKEQAIDFNDTKIQDYIKNGFIRNDGNPGNPEEGRFNALDTRYQFQALRFKDWLEGKYTAPAGETGTNTTVDLSSIIKTGVNGAIDRVPISLNEALLPEARENGVWIGYEGDDSSGYHLVVYINGEKKYDESSEEGLPDWLYQKHMIFSNELHYGDIVDGHPTSYRAQINQGDVLSIDVQAFTQDEDVKNSSGLVWIDYRNPQTDTRHNYKKAVRLVNGGDIDLENGLTVVSVQSVMIQDDFNTNPLDGEETPPPCAIVTDGYLYFLSKGFNPDEHNFVPSFFEPILPYGDVTEYLREVLGDGYWPAVDDPQREQKLQAIKDTLLDFYSNLPADMKAYGAPPIDKISEITKGLDLEGNPEQLNNRIVQYFKDAHDPRCTGSDCMLSGPLPAQYDPDDTVEINAAIVRNENVPDYAYGLETWRWRNGDDWVGGGEPSIVVRGSFPRVMDTENNDIRWSDVYSNYNFYLSLSTSDWRGVEGQFIPQRDVTWEPFKFDKTPPGNLNYIGTTAYFIEKDPSMFDKHPI